MKISIIATAYNQAHLLSRFLTSVAAQSSPPFEIVIIDDGSTVGDLQAVVAQAGVPNTRLIRQENAGVSRARNRGLAEARGDHVIFVDGDDWLLPRAVETLAAVAADNPRAAMIIGASRRVRLVTGDDIGENKPPLAHHYESVLAGWVPQHPAQCMFRKSALRIDCFDPHASPAEDLDVYLQVLAGHPAAATQEFVSCYAFHSANVSDKPFAMLRAVLHVHDTHRAATSYDKILDAAQRKGRRLRRSLYLGRCLAALPRIAKQPAVKRPSIRDFLLVCRQIPAAGAEAVFRRLFRHGALSTSSTESAGHPLG